MNLDPRRRAAVIVLALALLARAALFSIVAAVSLIAGQPVSSAALLPLLASVLLNGLPYLVLLLVSFAVRSRAAVWGGGIALLLAEVVDTAAPWLFDSRTVGMSYWYMLITPPASTVFVLPVGLLLGTWIGRRAGIADEPNAPRPQAAAALRTANIVARVGAAIVVITSLIGGTLQAGMLAFIAWALLPYAILVIAARVVRDPWAVAGAGAAAIAAEIGIRAGVFLFPRGSTAALALLFSPAFISLIVLPTGGALGWLLGRVWRAGGTIVHLSVATVSAILLALLMLSLARPDLMPGAVLRRRAALGRIGEPRVVVGADAFESQRISATSAWHQVSDYDGQPGDEIAIIDSRGAQLVDPIDFHELQRVEFNAELGRRWNWYSMLARLDGRLIVVQTGGGYSDTEVFDISGNLLWNYRPNPTLPPHALRPADLDADGQLEFYAAESGAIVRLDASGHDVWRRSVGASATLLLSEPRTASTAAWVAALEYPNRLTVWDENGLQLGQLTTFTESDHVMIADWPEHRALLIGSSTFQCVDLDGKVLFQFALGEFSLAEAIAVRLAPGVGSYLAIVAAAPRDVQRWRLVVLSPDQAVVYDEVLDSSVRLLKARRADGIDTLLVSGNGLRALRPVRP